MVEKRQLDEFGRSIITETKICDLLYQDPNFDYSNVKLVNDSKYNNAVDSLYLDWPKLGRLEEILENPDMWHTKNQKDWLMPQEYKDMDIVKWVLDQCKDETELQRAASEIVLFAEYEMIDLLRYLKYLIDTFRKNNIVWGVGRGSSVASFVLYLIGVHKINSIHYDLDITEFIR